MRSAERGGEMPGEGRVSSENASGAPNRAGAATTRSTMAAMTCATPDFDEVRPGSVGTGSQTPPGA